MPDFGDIEGLPPVTLDPAPDLASLAWPWDHPGIAGIAAPGTAAIPGAVDVATAAPQAPPIPDAAAPDGTVVPAVVTPGAQLPAAVPTGAVSPAAPPTVDTTGAQLPAMQPGLGIPRAALDPLIHPVPASPLPAAAPVIAPPDLGAVPPVVTAPAAEQPLTPAAGLAAPVLGELPSAPTPDGLAGFAPAPPAEPVLPPAPAPLSPAPVDLPAVEPVTGMLEPAGMPAESTLAGLAGAPPTAEQRYAAVAGEYQRDPGKLLDRLEQPGALDADTQRYLDEFTARDPAGAAVLRQRMIDAGTTRAAADRARLAKEDFDRQKANIDRLTTARAEAAKKSAAIDAEATKISETKIGYHPNTLQAIAGVLAAVVGGLYQGRTGSARNPGLDALNDVINRDLEQQKLNLANRRDILTQRRSALGELNARTNDEYQSDEIMRLAALKYADQQIAQAQLNFAPDGTRGLNLAAMRAGVNAQIAASKQTRDQKLFENSIKLQTAAREQQIADETAHNNRAQLGLGYARIAEDQEQRREAREARAADKAQERADKEAELDRRYTIGGVPHIRLGQDGKPVIGTDGKPAIDYDVLRNADGKAWRAPSDEAERDLRGKKTSATEVISMIDEVRAIRARVGGESKLLNSTDAQRLEVIKARTKLLIKQGTQGMSSDKDMETLEDAAGTTNADSWRDQEGRLTEARARTESSLNQAYRDAKYSGPAITFPEATSARNTASEDATQRLIQKPTESIDDVVAAKLADLQATRGYAIDLNNPSDRALYQEVVRDAHESHNPDASIEQRAQITDLGARASRGDADARQKLEVVARQGNTGALRALAQNQLDSSGRAHIATLSERGMGDGDTAVGARKELQRLTRDAPSLQLRALAQDQLNAIGRAKQAAADVTAAAPVDIPPELRLGGGQ